MNIPHGKTTRYNKQFRGRNNEDNSQTNKYSKKKTKFQNRLNHSFNNRGQHPTIYGSNINININLNFFIFNCTNCTIDDQTRTNAILSLLNSCNRKRPLSEVVNGIDEFHSNKRLKITRSGAAIRKYLPKNYYNSSNDKNKNYNYFGNELGWQNNNNNHNNYNCRRSSNLLNYKNNITMAIDHDISPPPPNDHESDGEWIDINSKTKTHPIHPYNDCTNNFSSFESENKQSNKSPSPCQPIQSPTRSRKNLGNVDIYQSKSKNRLGRQKKQKNKNENKKNVENQSFEWHPWLATIIEKLERDKKRMKS